MMPRQLKAAYYAAASVPMAVSGRLYRAFLAPTDGTVRVQLGPGKSKHLPGWINVDANAFSARNRPEVWADIRNTLPFRDGTVDCIYSHHVIEHLPDSDLSRHFDDLRRCLKRGGIIRIGGPNGDEAARQLLAGNANWFSDFPDKRASVGGRFANFLLCRGEHLTILTLSYMKELLEASGFVDVVQRSPVRETGSELLADALALEYETTFDAPHTLVVEARRP